MRVCSAYRRSADPAFLNWSYQHTNRIFPSADIARGSGPVSPLPYALRDLDEVSFVNSTTKQKMTVAQMYAATDTDALLVMKDGKIVTERYFNGMKPEDRHLLMSVSNSFGVGEAPRRSTSSLEANLDTGSALVYRIHYEQFGDHCFS